MTWRLYLIAFCLSVLLIQRIVTPGPGPVVPPVVPPVVVPPDIPDPPDIPVVEGRRTVVIIRESENDNPALARMIVALRSGANDEYLKAEGHTLFIHDDDDVDENGQPAELVQALKPVHPELPALFILESSDGRPLHHRTLPDDATAADVMAILKQYGG